MVINAFSWFLLFSIGDVAAGSPYGIQCVPPATSNLPSPPSTDFPSSVQVYSGVPYSSISISCTIANQFGPSANDVLAELVPSTMTTCSGSTVSSAGPIFDGLTKPYSLGPFAVRWTSPVTVFGSGGSYTVCYIITSPTITYSILPLSVLVRGAIGSDHKIFCMLSASIDCSIYLPGYLLAGDGSWKLALTSYTSNNCGQSFLSQPFSRLSSFVTAATSDYEVHDLGSITGTTVVNSYKACYCPGYQAQVTGSLNVYCTDTGSGYQNFVQNFGILMIMLPVTYDPLAAPALVQSVIYPRMRFSLIVHCGSGGCSADPAGPRVKIVDSNPLNLAPYHETNAGCRAAIESVRFAYPVNCGTVTANSCQLQRSDSPPDTANPTWNNLMLGNELMNGIRISRSFDVCYCDSACAVMGNWFMVGTITVETLTTMFLTNIVTDNIVAPDYLSIGTSGYVRIDGSGHPYGGIFRTSGSQSRELKFVSDNSATIGQADCLNTPQLPDLISGHDCYSTIDCEIPLQSNKTTQVFGPLVFERAGWVAGCFCNEGCSESLNWFVSGRLLVAGPAVQADTLPLWEAVTGLPTQILVYGYNLTDLNLIKLIDLDPTIVDPCNAQLQPIDSIKGPLSPAGVTLSGIVAAVTDGGYLYKGSILQSASPHGLSVADRITVTGVVTHMGAPFDAMFNSEFPIKQVIDEFSVLIDVVFDSGRFPNSIAVTGAMWWRSNQMLYTEIVGLRAGTYTVCWSPGVGVPYAGIAGTLKVSDPLASLASLKLGTIEQGRIGSSKITFRTSQLNEYVDESGQTGDAGDASDARTTQLLVTLNDPSLFDMVNAISELPISVGSAVNASTARLDFCGEYFAELYAIEVDAVGFPYPLGCFAFDDPSTGVVRRTYGMVFAPQNGLAPDTEYSIVVKGRGFLGLSPVSEPAAVTLWSVGPTGDVIETFAAQADRAVSTAVPNPVDFTIAVTTNGGSSSISGFCQSVGSDDAHKCMPCYVDADCAPGAVSGLCVSPVDGACLSGLVQTDLATFFAFKIEFSLAGSSQVVGGSTVRIILGPVTLWSLPVGQSVDVLCVAISEGTTCGGGGPPTTPTVQSTAVLVATVLDTYVLEFQLLLDMDPVTSLTDFSFTVASLPGLPKHGFINGFVQVEVGPGDVSSPGFSPTLSNAVGLINSGTNLQFSSLELVEGAGNNHPFVSDLSNELFLKFQPAFNIPQNAAVTVTLPQGYVCRMAPVVGCVGRPEVCAFASTNGGVPISAIPSGRGTIGQRTIESETYVAGWSSVGNTCLLTLGPSTVVFASSSIYLSLLGDNPLTTLFQDSADNQWTLSVASGYYTSPDIPITNNVAVLGKLDLATITPLLWGAGAERNALSVFFRANSDCGSVIDNNPAYVVVDAPEGFDFGPLCETAGIAVSSCVGEVVGDPSATTYNRATIQTDGQLYAGVTYGFSLILARNKEFTTLLSGSSDWAIRTKSDTTVCEGSVGAVGFNRADSDERAGRSWTVHQGGMGDSQFNATFDTLAPGSVSAEITLLFSVSLTNSSSITIVAPFGFEWNFGPLQFFFQTDSVPGATRDLPLSVIPPCPLRDPLNVLRIDRLEWPLEVGPTYGIRTKISLPSENPPDNVFVVLLGDRVEAGTFAGPKLQRMQSPSVSYSTTLKGLLNQVCVSFELVSFVDRGGAAVITPPSWAGPPIADPRTGQSSATCVLRPWRGDFTSLLPNDSICAVSANLRQVLLIAGPSGIPNEVTYNLCLYFQNPNFIVTSPDMWEFKSVVSLAYVTPPVLDAPASVEGFPVNELIGPNTRIVTENGVSEEGNFCVSEDSSTCTALNIGRNDRPSAVNNVLLLINVVGTSTVAQNTITVTAPIGFAFDRKCFFNADDPLNGIDVSGLGGDVSLTLLGDNTVSGGPVNILACEGSDNTAKLTLDTMLPIGPTYVLRLDHVQNPPSGVVQLNSTNFWQIQYKSFSTAPMEGFPLWEFGSSVMVTATDPSVGANPNLVKIMFSPYNDVPMEGGTSTDNNSPFIAVSAPPGFTVPSVCDARDASGLISMTCVGSPHSGNTFLLKDFSAPLVSNTEYEFWVNVVNPATVSPAPGEWTITSYLFDNPAGVLDNSTVPGFAITESIPSFSLVSVSTVSASMEAVYQLSFTTVHEAVPGDVIAVSFPDGYVLSEIGMSQCPGFVLLDESADAMFSWPPPTCGDALKWEVPSTGQPLSAGSLVAFGVTTQTPVRTPVINYFSLAIANDAVGIKAAKTVAGIEILEAMTGVSVGISDDPVYLISAGSEGVSIVVEFTPTISGTKLVVVGSIHDRLNSNFVNGNDNSIQLVFDAETLVPDVLNTVILKNITIPQTTGVSEWSISLFNATNHLVNQVTKIPGPIIVGKIEVFPQTSFVYPKLYTTQYSMVTLNFTSSVSLLAGWEVIVSAPPGYLLYNDSFLVVESLFATSTEFDPEARTVAATIQYDILQNTPMALAFRSDLPSEPQNTTNWAITVVDTTSALKATNDGIFPGFSLIALAPFSVDPQNFSPGALINLTTTFAISGQVEGVNVVSVQIVAPAEFVFSNDCLAAPSGGIVSCSGNGANTAVLQTDTKVLLAGTISLTLQVSNAPSTPTVNTWSMNVYPDTDVGDVKIHDSTNGYEILAMPATFVGGNKLGTTTVGFWTFQLTRSISTGIGFLLEISPDITSGYVLLCFPSLQVGFKAPITCTGGDAPNEAVTLAVPESEITPDLTFTVGLALDNPSLPVVGLHNIFALVVKDPGSNSTLDSNLNVQGENLRSALMSGAVLKYDSASPRSLTNVIIGFSLEADLVSTTAITTVTIVITSPNTFSISSASSVVTTSALPLSTSIPVSVENNILTLTLEPLIAAPVGSYTIQLPVMNPGTIPSNNVWTLNITNSGILSYLVPIEGYQFN